MKPVNVPKEINYVINELLQKNFFYGHLISNFLIRYDDSVETFAVGKHKDEVVIKLFVSPAYVTRLMNENLPLKVYAHLRAVLTHEIHHVIFNHLSIKMPDAEIENIAKECDCNSYLNRNDLLNDGHPKAGVFPEDFNFPPRMGFIWYYNELLKLKSSDKSPKDVKDRNSSIDSDIVGNSDGDESTKDVVRSLVQNSIKICKQLGKQYGDVAGIAESLLEHKTPIIPWSNILRHFIASCYESSVKFTIRKRSKRFGSRPGICIEEVLKICVAIDTSGSISDEWLSLFFAEIFSIQKNGAIVDVVECDSEIQRIYPFKEYDGHAKGRGGTDLEPPLIYASENKYDMVIYFTDLCAPHITTKYNIPVLFVSTYKTDDPPYKHASFIFLDDYDVF